MADDGRRGDLLLHARTFPGRAVSKAATRPALRRVLLVGLTLYPVVLVLLATQHGPGMSVDSVYYAHAARSFAATGEFLAFGGPLTVWPPGLPALLGSALRLGLDLETVALVIDVGCAAATVLLTYVLGRDVLRSRALGLLAASVVALSLSTVRVYAMVWTEPLFSVLVLLLLVLLTRTCARSRFTWWDVLMVGLLVSVATTLRFVGLALIPVVVVATLWATRNKGWALAAVTAAVAGVASSLGLMVVALRNVSLGVAPLGDRASSGLSPVNVVGHSLRALGRYVLPETGGLMPVGGDPVGNTFVVGTVLTIVLGAVVALILSYAVWIVVRTRYPGLAVLVGFVASWWAILWYSSISSGVDPPNERLLAPAFAAMVILALNAGRHLGGLARGRSRSVWTLLASGVRVGAVVILAVTMLAGGVFGAAASWASARTGIGYNSVASRTSPLAVALTTLPPGATMAASDPWLAYWIARRSTVSLYDGRLPEMVKSGKVDYLAFFDSSTGPDHKPAVLMDDGFRIRLVGTFADGTLYEATHG